MSRKPLTEEEVLHNFYSRIEKQHNGCWNWTGAIGSNGYGSLVVNGKLMPAHRYAYSKFIGQLKENGRLGTKKHCENVVHHKCHNKRCVNPEHLEQLSNHDNLLLPDGSAGKNLRKTHCPYGHEYDEFNTMLNKRKQRHCKICVVKKYLKYLGFDPDKSFDPSKRL